MKFHPEYARWPTLLGAVTLTGAGLGLDLAEPASSPFAAACLALGAVSFGAFIYAEGARHRDWTEAERAERPDRPTGDEDGPGRSSSRLGDGTDGRA